MKAYNVLFRIKGTMLGNDVELNKENLKESILCLFDDKRAKSYYDNRSIDCEVKGIKILQYSR